MKTLNLFKRKKQVEVEHDWRFGISKLTTDHKQERKLYQCEDCGKYKEEFVTIKHD